MRRLEDGLTGNALHDGLLETARLLVCSQAICECLNLLDSLLAKLITEKGHGLEVLHALAVEPCFDLLDLGLGILFIGENVGSLDHSCGRNEYRMGGDKEHNTPSPPRSRTRKTSGYVALYWWIRSTAFPLNSQ